MVIGDIILDRYVWGDVERVSPEAPIQVLHVGRDDFRLGGAGNVAANLQSLGAEVAIVGLRGDDEDGARLLERLAARDIATDGVVVADDRPTIVKTRHMAQNQQILRVDRERVAPATDAHRDAFVAQLDAFRPDCVILSDYGKGALTADTLRATIDRARALGVPVLVDPKTTDYRRYAGATAITPNRAEFEAASGLRADSPERIRQGADALIRDADLAALVITLGAEGICLIERNGDEIRIPTRARSVYDVTGAGDTVIAVLGFALAGGLGLADGVRLANVGAGIVVGRVGAAVTTVAEIREALLTPDRLEGGKIRARDEIRALAAELRAAGKRVVLTNGCFDLMHAGHAEYLAYARSLGSVLIVGVNSDDSVRRMSKGPGRPIVSLDERMRLLAALEAVDVVVAFEDDTPASLVADVLPDVLVKGEDWRDRGVIGREEVEGHGGEVVLAPLRPGISTSVIIERIRSATSAAETADPNA